MAKENIEIKVNADELDQKLSKSMKLLGVHHDEYGRLVNKQNQFVGGLSQARIKMGDYINAQGQMCDREGRLQEGLTATELKLRMYRDAENSVRDATGKLVRISEERIAALDEEGKKAVRETKNLEDEIEAIEKASEARIQMKKANDAYCQSLNAIGKMSGNLAQVAAIFGQMGGSAGQTAQTVAKLSQTFQIFVATSQAIKGIKTAYTALTIATETQKVAQIALNFVSMNPLVTLGGAVAAAATAYSLFKKKTDSATESIEIQMKKVDEITVAYHKMKQVIDEAEKRIQAGAIAASVSESEIFDERIKNIEELTEAYHQAERRLNHVQKKINDYNSNTSTYRQKFDDLMESVPYASFTPEDKKLFIEEQAKKKDLDTSKTNLQAASDDLARWVSQMVKQDLPRDELSELKDRAEQYSKILEIQNLDEQARLNVEKALAENQRKQNDIIQRQISEKEKAEQESAEKEAAEAAKKLAEAERALGDKFAAYADGSALMTAEEKAATDLTATIETWKANFEAAGKTEAELNNAIANLTKEYDQKRLDQFLQANGLKLKEQEELSALDQYNETLKKIQEAEETYGLQAAEAEKLRAQATEDYADALAKKAEEEEKQKESRLSELGITNLRESMKSPFEKFLEQQMKVTTALKEGLIDSAEAQMMNGKLVSDYLAQNSGEPTGEEEPFEREEYKSATTMTAGSNELYQAMTQRESSQERYQTGVTKNLTEMNRYASDNNQVLQSIQNNLGEVMKAVGVV